MADGNSGCQCYTVSSRCHVTPSLAALWIDMHGEIIFFREFTGPVIDRGVNSAMQKWAKILSNKRVM